MENEKWGTGNGKREMGNGRRGNVKRRTRNVKKDQGMGHRKGKKERGTGNGDEEQKMWNEERETKH